SRAGSGGPARNNGKALMSEQAVQRITTAILTLAAAVLAGVLLAGVLDGRLAPRSGPGSVRGSQSAGSSRGDPAADAQSGAADAPLFNDGGEEGLLVLADNRTRLVNVSLPSGEVTASVRLPAAARSVVTTPGGVSAWITFEDRTAMEVYTTGDLTHEATVTPEGAESDAPAHLTFNENGDTLFVTWAQREAVSVYRHDMRELSLLRQFSTEETRGPVLRDRRATRVYRLDRDGTVISFFARNGERLDTHEGIAFAAETSPAFDPAFAALWGADTDGQAAGLDIRSGAVNRLEDTATEEKENAVTTDMPPVFVEQSGRAIFATAERDGILLVSVDPPEGAVVEGQVKLSDLSEVTGNRITALAEAGNGAVLLVTDDGELVLVNGRTTELHSVTSLHQQAGGPEGSIGAEDGITRAVAWQVQEEGNFACF
ncbi:MAG: YncE family protein, partial [Spirochaetaceae bacterium]